MSLILHCGAKPINYDELRSIPVPDRNHRWVGKMGKTYEINRSERWEGLQHADFAEAIELGCSKLGMPIDMERTKWGVSEDGSDLFGHVKFKQEVDGKDTSVATYFKDDYEPSMGLRHSNRGKFSAQATIGGSVTVCDNLVITGTVVFRQKHTTHNMANIIDNARLGLVDYILGLPRLTGMVDGLKASCLTDQHVSKLYLAAGRSKLLPWSHLGQVDEYWQNPTHTEFTEGGYTGWRMYNAINTVAKKYNPSRQMDIVRKAEDIISNHCQTINF